MPEKAGMYVSTANGPTMPSKDSSAAKAQVGARQSVRESGLMGSVFHFAQAPWLVNAPISGRRKPAGPQSESSHHNYVTGTQFWDAILDDRLLKD